MTSIWVTWMNLDTQWNTRWNTTRFSSEMKHVFHLRSNMFFIWDQTCFSSEIKHLHFNEIFIDYTTHGNNAIPVVNNNSQIWDHYWRYWTLILTEQLAKEQLLSCPALTTSWASELVKQLKSFSSAIFTSVALVLGPNTDDTSVIYSLLGFSYLNKESEQWPVH